MVHKTLLWAGFGVAVRFWQLGIQMLPFFGRKQLWGYPVFAGFGGAFGYWMTTVERKQTAILAERKRTLLEKRARRDAREAEEADKTAGVSTTEATAAME